MRKAPSILFDRTPSFSFEFFPPKTEEGARSLLDTVLKLQEFHPSFVSVTYGAGGGSRELTRAVVHDMQSRNIPTVPHLTCVSHTEAEIEQVLEAYTQAGARAVMALRGDPPRNRPYDPSLDAFRHAADLVRFIRHWEERRRLPYRLTIGVAGFAEGHPDARNRIREMDFLKAKIDEGADYICTQLFFDNHAFFDFRDRCRILGIDVPIIAGIMPVTSISSMNRMADLSPGTNFPARLLKAMLRAGGDRESIERIGINYASNQCSELLDEDVDGIHFYTLNRSKATLQIYRNLGINNCYDVDRIHMLNELYNS
ncbi:MAG TPA: methylenetetrahydrofolate reductase [NAD(P)H] [Candidatus Akkermansia intestinigallinarum]|uniref:Methylenetetrahydrofolate reductase n=1 Tax=Candidatus Akkermansia intestinigallinarum TaxID=2838431 RepID=A0A9D2AH73_9BACT|nr:methylenetetrahydrofolate reductase [NAD(P)H] [Candidatus Akkermansia intestinigallinarum]